MLNRVKDRFRQLCVVIVIIIIECDSSLVNMAQSSSTQHAVGGRQVAISLMTLFTLAFNTINAENLDIAVDAADQSSNEFTLDNPASTYGKPSIINTVKLIL